jgi:hypothetical protein
VSDLNESAEAQIIVGIAAAFAMADRFHPTAPVPVDYAKHFAAAREFMAEIKRQFPDLV